MITINLQWLMWPCIVYALYCLYYVGVGVYYIAFGREIEPLAGMYVASIYGPRLLLSALLAFLFWRAFR